MAPHLGHSYHSPFLISASQPHFLHFVNIKCGRCHLRSNSIVSGGAHKITVVREKSKALKLYIDRKLDASGYDSRAKAKINTVIDSDAEDFNVIEKATPYDEIITLKNILAGVGKRKLFK